MADDALIRDIVSKIAREKKLIEGYTHLRQSSSNPQVQNSTDVQIRDARRNIQYFEGRLAEHQSRNGIPQQHRGPAGPTTGRVPFDPNDVGTDYGEGNYSDLANPNVAPPRGPFAPGPPGAQQLKGRPNYSRLDLIKDDSPHLGPRIQLMLSQLQFKLNVEKQYKDGTEKLMSVYGHMEGDRKTKADAEAKRAESIHKIQLMSQALKRYEDLHLDMDTGDVPDDDSVNGPTLRKPLTGLLAIRIHAISDVNHAITGRFSRGPDTFVILKIEDETKGRTRATRTDKWSDEYLEIEIDKGNEIELTVYDRVSGDYPRPIGLLWIPIADIAEEMRRKKIEHDFNQAGWVSADKMENGGAPQSNMRFNPPPGSQPGGPPGGPMGPGYSGSGGPAQPAPGAIKAWFSLEPYGRIELTLHFTKQTRERQPVDVTAGGGIQRKGAIRQRREDVHELYGHKFIAQSFYNIMRCAFCGELCKNGMKCSDCKYMCHEKCYPKVVTKCISKSNSESDPDEAKLNHRIPHRFEPFANIAAKWCCHCGYMLPFGRKQPRQCRECKLTAHAECTHLVPDFCGMSMETASEALRFIEANRARKPMQKTLRPDRGRPPVTSSDSTLSSQFGSQQSTLVDSAKSDRLSYTREGEEGGPSGSQSRPTSGSTQGSGAASYSQSKQEVPRRPVAGARVGSSDAAQAAAMALRDKNQTSPTESRPYPIRMSSGQPTSPTKTQAPPPPQHAPYNPGSYADYDNPYSQPQPAMQAPYQTQSPVQMPSQPQTPSQPPTQPQPQPQPQQLPPQTQAPARTQPVPQVQLPKVTPAEPQRPVSVQKPAALAKKTEEPAAQPPAQAKRPRVGLDHFNFLAVLGKGNFGKVMLAETKATKKLYAIKVLKKEFIIENDEVESTRSERDVYIIANKARHPFLLNLHACFQTETRVYFVMEYISGGDLMLHIQRGQFGPKRAQFYAAEVCLALKYFHENGVVYRDLKLDNILLTLDGHIKIADYGLCKMNMHYGSTTSTFCGTPEFMAPEILLDKKYGRGVDWWAFGVLIYQMLLQQSPFRGEDEDEIYDAILADEPLYPIHMPRDSVSILQKLLTREPEMRLGSGPTDAQEIMSHAFFRNVNWDDIQNKRVPAPFMPQIKNATDTSNFDSEFTSVTPVLTPVQSVLSQRDQEEFRGFSYSADFV